MPKRLFFHIFFVLLRCNNLKQLYEAYMEQHISQDEIRQIIISDMVKKRNSIVPVIGKKTIYFGVSFVFLWLFYETLKGIRSVFEKGLKALRSYLLLVEYARYSTMPDWFNLRRYDCKVIEKNVIRYDNNNMTFILTL